MGNVHHFVRLFIFNSPKGTLGLPSILFGLNIDFCPPTLLIRELTQGLWIP